MNDEKRKDRNHSNLGRFKRVWQKKGFASDRTMLCHVRVRYRELDREMTTMATFYPNGQVQLHDSDWFSSDDHYSLFSPITKSLC